MIEFYNINDKENASYEIIGNGMQKTLFIIYDTEYGKYKDKLDAIIKAIGLDPKKDIIILLLSKMGLGAIHSTIDKYGITRVVSFGLRIKDIFPNIVIQEYQVVKTEIYSWLSAPSLHSILSDLGEKKKLWNALKLQFQLKQ